MNQDFRQLLDAVPQIVFTANPDGSVDYSNLTLTTYAGIHITRENDWSQVVHPDDLAQAVTSWQEATRTDAPYFAEMRIIRISDHTYRWHQVQAAPIRNSDGTVLKWYGTATDIHDRKLMEQEARRLAERLTISLANMRHADQELRHSRQRFEDIAKATSDALWDWDLDTDHVWRNGGYAALFGFHGAEERSDVGSWSSHIHPDDRDQILAGLHAAIAGAGEKWSAEYRFRRRDGSYASVLDRGFILRDDAGKAVRMVGGISDLSLRKQSEESLARVNRALRLLSACNEALIHATDEGALIDKICRIAVDVGQYELAWVGYAESDEKCSIVPKASAGVRDYSDYVSSLQTSWAKHDPRGQEPGGQSIRAGKPMFCADIEKDPTLDPWAKASLENNLRAVVSLPLCGEQRPFGLIAMYSSQPSSLNDEEVRLLQDLANNVAFGIRNLRAREESKQLENAVIKVASGVSARSGAEFFEHLALSMAGAVGAQAGVIAKFVGDAASVRTLCAVVYGEKIQNFEYGLAGAPCETLLHGNSSVVLQSAAHLFPSGFQLAGIGAKTYIGLRLDDAQGGPLGLLYVLFHQPPEKSDFVVSTLKIFAARAAAEMERYNSDSRIRDQASLLDKTQDAVIVCDVGHRILFWNKGAERLYGWTAAEASGKIKSDLLHADPVLNREGTMAVIRHGEWSGQFTYRRKDGSTVPVEAHWSLVRDDDGKVQSIFTINTDITQRVADEREIEKLAFFDTLTGLPNRRLLHNRLQKALDDSVRSGAIGALLYIDLDNFKSINDTVGHHKGDLLLQQVAGRLQSCIRRANTVARLGGDEFVIVLENLGDHDARAAALAEGIAEKVVASFRPSFQLNGVEHHTTPSVGVALFNGSMRSVDELLKRADLAMYQAKAAGRDAIRFFDPEMQRVINARVAMESDIREGLHRQAFCLYYQPQADYEGRLTGTEALLRWRHPVHGDVAPHEFIPLAEETGLIMLLGEWVLDSACAQLARWASVPANAGLTIAVNVSARQFRRADFVQQVLGALARNGADPHKLKLELTESLLIDDLEATVIKMSALKAEGVSFSLDDFGTGYSSLAYLKRLPLDQLKIDQSFVNDVLTDPNDAAIARTIVALGQSLGLNVLAEGVETVEQRDFLAASGCRAYQGYLYGRPTPVEEFESVARTNFAGRPATPAAALR